jgi:thiol:disulfide interchange protein DsbD
VIRLLSLLALAGLAPGAFAAVEDDLLPPDQAFRLEARGTAAGVELHWTIADGYYLYRDKLRYRARDADAVLGQAALPAGIPRDDPFFGRLETYRGSLVVEVPVAQPPASGRLALEVSSQGCADVGICYPPQTRLVAVDLPPAPAAAPAPVRPAAAGALQALADLGRSVGLAGAGDDDFLEPDQAFRHYVEVAPDGTVLARWEVADGYYLYRDKFRFEVASGTGVTLGAATLPPGKMKEDPAFGRVEVYYQGVEARVPITAGAPGAPFEVEVRYQGCAEAGLCYPPMTKRAALVLPAAFSPGAAPVAAPSAPAEAPVSEQDRLAASLASDSVLVTALWFFGFGLLLAFTPCVFPMIPILSGIIVGQGSRITTRRAFVLSVTYVLAMSVTYTIAGVVAGLFGANLQAALQNPWVLSSFALVFVLLALSMFGFYELQLPSSWQSRLTELSNRQRGGTLLGVAVMGLLSALIVGPCVAPPLAGALIYIGQTGDPWLGGLALFALSMGMGQPLVAVGTLEGRYLPRAGAWMNAVKAVFGVALLGVAAFLLERVLPGWAALLLWSALFVVSGVYLGALEPLGLDASGFRKLWKGLGLLLLVYGVILMVGAASGGGGGVLQPLRGLGVASAGDGHEGLAFRQVKGPAGLEAALAETVAAGRPAVLDFYADWCVACKELEAYTFSDPGVQETLSGATLLQADVTDNDAEDRALLQGLGLIGPPAILFFGPDGVERRGYRLVGFKPAAEFRAHAERALQ